MSDITSLVKACLLILGIATSLGDFEDVQRWAIMEVPRSRSWIGVKLDRLG